MLIIVLKIILCSGILLSLFYVFLAKEKTFAFNRFFLIFALLFSLCMPFVSIETKQAEREAPETVLAEQGEDAVLQASSVAETEVIDYKQIFIIAYFSITLFLILKIAYSVLKIKKLKGRKIIYFNRKVCLLKQDLAPFSFLNTIYLSETYFIDSKIENSVFIHEEIHVKQRHSLDILFVEILKAVFWINPFIYFYKNAIINNHEFIADEWVISQNKNIKEYQELILKEILKQQNLPLIHQFNFNNTKKRFIMMTSKTSKFAKAKKYLAIPAFAALALVFAEKTYAKDTSENPRQNVFQEESILQAEKFKNIKPVKNEEVVIGFNGIEYNDKKKDTISPRKNINTEVSEVKTMSEKLNSKAVQDISTAVEGVAADLVPAEYPGGVNKLRNLVSANFDSSLFENNKEMMRTEVFIMIDENGKANNINAVGENEKFNAEAAKVVKLANENVTWMPAKKDGQPVRYRYKIPLAMQFAAYKKAQ